MSLGHCHVSLAPPSTTLDRDVALAPSNAALDHDHDRGLAPFSTAIDRDPHGTRHTLFSTARDHDQCSTGRVALAPSI